MRKLLLIGGTLLAAVAINTECWGPYEFRESATKGRYLLVGPRQESGALVDLNVPSVLAYDDLEGIEALGADVNLVPGGE